MWINWRQLRCVKSYLRLALALSLSFILHLLLLGQINFNLPDSDESTHLIEARLEAVRPISENKSISETKVVEPPAKKVAPPRRVQPAPPEPVPQHSPVEPSLSADNPAPIAEQAAANVHDAIEPSQPEVLEETVGINPDAYKYVETDFDVRTEVDAKVDASPAGSAKMVYQLLPDGKQYQLTSLMQAKGLLSLFMPDLLQTSDGMLTTTGLQPQHFLYQFGDKKNKSFSADFDWQNRKLLLHSVGGVKEAILVDGAQDLLSFMYQFMFVAPLENMQLHITNGKKLTTYDYSFEGEEKIATKIGTLLTVHLMRRSAEGEERTELWLALDYQYVPVKIRKTEKDGKVYELLVNSLKTEKPAIQ